MPGRIFQLAAAFGAAALLAVMDLRCPLAHTAEILDMQDGIGEEEPEETLQPSLEHSVSKVEFNILYPTLSPTEPIFLPDELAARDEKQKVEKDRPKVRQFLQ